MKKFMSVISVLLTVCMILSMNVFAADKELSDIDPNTLVGKAVNELVSLDIIDGYTDGTFKPDNTVTRAEMAKLIVAFMGLDDIGLNATSTGFPDVDSTNHWSIPYVKIAVDQGIIVGYEDGTFKPDNTVKYSEAVKMVVCALGYGTVAVNRTLEGQPWYSGYIGVAAEKGVLNGAATNSQESAAPRGIVAVLLYNALDVAIAEVSTKNGTTSVKVGDTTARDAYQKTEQITGVVTGVYQTGLDTAETGLGKKFIEITSNGVTKKYRINSDIDTYSLLGYKINANIDEDSSDDDVLSSISTKDSKNIVNVINAGDIESASTGEISYWESKNSTRTTTITFSSDVSVIYNGRYLANPKASDFNIKAGTIKTISNDGNVQADVVFINSYEIFAVSNIGTDSATGERKIYPLYNEGNPKAYVSVPTSATCKNLKITNYSGILLDDPKKLSVSKYDVANILQSKDGAVFELTMTRNKVSGTISSIVNGERIVIQGKEYSVSYSLQDYTGSDKPSLSLSSNVTAYLDMFGDIAAAQVSSVATNTNTYVGYLIYGQKEDGISGIGKVRLYGVSNISGDRSFELASKTKIDGVLYNDYSKMLDALQASSAKANAGKDASDIIATDYAQLIFFTLKNGQIDSIDTIEPNDVVAEDDLTMDVSYPYPSASDKGGLRYVSGSKFQNTANSTVMAINSTSRILFVPDDMSKTDKYKILSTGYFSISNSKRYRIEAYNMSEAGVASFAIVYGGSTGSSTSDFDRNSSIYLTKGISTAIGTVDGEEVTQDKFYGWDFKNGAEINDKRTSDEGIIYGTVENGEIFRVATDEHNLIKKIEMILDIDGDDLILFPTATRPNALNPVKSTSEARNIRDISYDTDNSKNSSICRMIYATALYVDPDGKSIKFATTLKDDECGILSEEFDYLNLNSSLKVFTLDLTSTDMNNRTLSDGSYNDIVSVDDVGVDHAAEASQILMFCQSGSVRTILIIKR